MIFINFNNPLFRDIYADFEEFKEDSLFPPWFQNEYFEEGVTNEISKFSFDLLIKKYGDNLISGNEENFKINFQNRYIESIVKYWNFLNGDLTKIKNVFLIGSSTVTGGIPTTSRASLTEEEVLKTFSNYTLNKGDFSEIANILKSVSIEYIDFFEEFKDLFQVKI